MRGIGRGTAKVIQDGRWIAGDDEQDQPLADGTFVLTWQFHWVSGWAPQHGEYRATMADSYGNAEVYRGPSRGVTGWCSSRWPGRDPPALRNST
jgi:hypothetical protein